jgi:outer membrane protein OmpA-like peptidoglycan-associated protein
MRFRNLLLTASSVTLLSLVPAGMAHAQDASDPALVAAYQAFQSTQNKANQRALNEACIGAGFQSLDDCIAALSGTSPIEKSAPAEEAAPTPAPAEEPAPAPKAEQPAPPPTEEAAPVSSEQPAPTEKPKAERPKAEKPKAEKPSREKPSAPAAEESAPPPAAEAPAPVEQPAPAPVEEPAPVEQPAPAARPAVQPAAPVSEEAAPAPSSEEAAPAAKPGRPNVVGQLTAAVDLYNEGVADLDSGNKGGQAKVDRAKGQIDAICSKAGFADTTACLEQFGLALNPLPPAAGEQPATPSERPAPPPATENPAQPETPLSELPAASEEVTPSAVEVLPADVAGEAAPILDSAKDDHNDRTQGQPPRQPGAKPTPAQPAAPPPVDDKAAQKDLQPPPKAEQSVDAEKGKRRPGDFTFNQPKPPAGKDVKVVEQPKNDKGGFVFQIGVNLFIDNQQQERDRFYDQNRGDEIYYEDLSRGRTRETIERHDGSKVVTIYSANGEVLQRSKFMPNGREIILSSYDPRDRDYDTWRDPGLDLPPLRLTIPASQYILDADYANESQVYNFLDQPPVEQVRRIYTIDEVKRSARLRDSVRRLEVGGLTFDTAKATISRDQVGALSKVAEAMQKMLDKDPGEVFLIEGHTDAVGSDVSNLVLSDQRAATVARILTDFYEIPAENLVTQGYGKRYLKVQTQAAEPLNRRVTIKRITPLVSYASN